MSMATGVGEEEDMSDNKVLGWLGKNVPSVFGKAAAEAAASAVANGVAAAAGEAANKVVENSPVLAAADGVKQVADAGKQLAATAFAETGSSAVKDSVQISKEELAKLMLAQKELQAVKAGAGAERAVGPEELRTIAVEGAKFIPAPEKLMFTSLEPKAASELAKQLNLDPKAYMKFAEAAKALDPKKLRTELSDTQAQKLAALFVPALPALALWNVFMPVTELQKLEAIKAAREAISATKFVEAEGGKAILRGELEAVKASPDIRSALMDRIAKLESKMQAEPAGIITAALLRAYLKSVSPFAMMPLSINTGHSRKNAALMDLEALNGGGEAHLKAQFDKPEYWDKMNAEVTNFVLAALLSVHQAGDEKSKDRLSGAYEQFGRVNTIAADIRSATKAYGTVTKWVMQARIWLSGLAGKPEIKDLEASAKKHGKELVNIFKTRHEHGQKNLATRLTDWAAGSSGVLDAADKALASSLGVGEKLKLAAGLNRAMGTALDETRAGIAKARKELDNPAKVSRAVNRVLQSAPLGG